MRTRLLILVIFAAIIVGFGQVFASEVNAQVPTPTQAPVSSVPPPQPMVLIGNVTADGIPIPDGLTVVGRIEFAGFQTI